MAILRHYLGKKNGVIPGYAMDDLYLFKLETDKKNRKTKRRPRDGYGKDNL